jgi:UDP-N-acetylglucosamine enolpyruvyl transferase
MCIRDRVKRATLNPVNAQVIPDPIEVGKFLITGASINDAKIGSVTLTMSNFWSDFERKSGITTTIASAQRFNENETGFINAIDIDKELEWGGQ